MSNRGRAAWLGSTRSGCVTGPRRPGRDRRVGHRRLRGARRDQGGAGGAGRRPGPLCEYGIADDEAVEVGLSCGGTVGILIAELDTTLVPALDEQSGPTGLRTRSDRERREHRRALVHDGSDGPVARLLAGGESALADVDGAAVFVHSLLPRPQMYIFGAIDHAAALARVGKLLGYRVTVCDARARFVTPARFPEADELVVDWPDRCLRSAPVDARTAICVLRTTRSSTCRPSSPRSTRRPPTSARWKQGDDRRPRGAAAGRGRR